jgi:nucleoside-diphosphate-sugar epimerase
MKTVFVTGGTGLIGSNICEQLIRRGDRVRALARPGSETGPLRDLGVEIVEGDITDAASVTRAAEGCEGVIHSAAVLGGPTQDMGEHQRVNTGGVANVFDAAQAVGIQRVVTLGTTTYFDFKTSPLTESSPVDPDASGDPYTVTKCAAFLEAMRRADAGLDVSVVIPGGTFGPAPAVHRAMAPPSFNLRIVWALQGNFDAAVSFPIPWSLASDVAYASIAALDRGRRGEKYLAFAGQGDVSTMATFCNRACEIAGVPHRVREITATDLDASEEVRNRVGPSLVALAHQRFPEPYFVNELTVERLDYHPQSIDDGLRATVEWLHHHDLVS